MAVATVERMKYHKGWTIAFIGPAEEVTTFYLWEPDADKHAEWRAAWDCDITELDGFGVGSTASAAMDEAFSNYRDDARVNVVKRAFLGAAS